MRSMNAPGSPSSPLQTTYFFSRIRGTHRRPLQMRRKPGPAPAAKAADLDLLDHGLRRKLLDRLLQALEAAVALVLVQVGRVDVAAMLRRDVNLPAQEIGDRLIPHVDRIPRDRLPLLVGQQVIQRRGHGIGELPVRPAARRNAAE